MVNRASTVVRDDDLLFVKNGVPVNFCFHRSVTQGRGKITRDVERHGGRIVQDERRTDVLLVDEQEDIAFMRRRYYSSTEKYRQELYVEPRGFVQTCIRSGEYRHFGPTRRGMPGRASDSERIRVRFTEEDKEHLAYYIATRCPTKDGRMGNSAYKDLERLGETDDPSWEWARRHTFHSWREHYRLNRVTMDARINRYLQRLKNVGHHFGHDPRRHNHRNMRIDEDEDEEEEEEQRRGIERQDRVRRERVRPAVAAAARAQSFLARQEEDFLSFDDEEDDAVQEATIQEQRRVKHHRIHTQQQRDARETQAKRARLSEASVNERRAPSVEVTRDERSPVTERESDDEDLQEIEGSDLFGDRAYDEKLRFNYDDFQDFPVPFSPRAGPVPEQDGAPVSTQATLVASPLTVPRKPIPTSGPTPTKVIKPQEPQVTAAQLTVPNSHKTSAVIQERMVVPRQRVRGASAQPGPSVPNEARARGGVAAVEVPLQNTRARSHSVDPWPVPEPQRAQPREDRGGKGKGKAKEALIPIEEDEQVEEEPEGAYYEEEIEFVATGGPLFEDEKAVEDLLERSVGDEEDRESGGAEGIEPGLSRSQRVEIGSEPTDSDDAETHGSLVRGAARVGSAGGREFEPDQVQDRNQELERDSGSDSDSDSDSEDGDRIERMANASLHVVPAPTPPQPRVTRSQLRAQAQTQISPRRTRSGNEARKTGQPSLFSSQGTKARAVVDLREEERKMPYAPPDGSRAAKVVKGKGRGEGPD